MNVCNINTTKYNLIENRNNQWNKELLPSQPKLYTYIQAWEKYSWVVYTLKSILNIVILGRENGC